MSVVMAVYVGEWVRSPAFPLATSISVNVDEVSVIVERFKGFVGEGLFKEFERVFSEALRNEVVKALNTDILDRDIHTLVERFWARLSLPMVELSYITSSLHGDALNELIDLEEELATYLAKRIRSSGYRYAENLVYGLSVLVDRDVWVLRRVSELGFDGFVKRLVDRDPKTLMEFAGYTAYLTFAWVASTATVLGIIESYREKNRDTLALWCKKYAEELEGYIDTLDILLKDEVYEELVELGIVKR